MDFIRSAITRIFGVHWVVLTDMDGEVSIRKLRYRGGEPYAVRHGFGVRHVGLLDGGKLSNGCYVKSWKPYDPSAPKKLPSWHSSETSH